MGDDRPARYVERDERTGEETVVYRASSLGGCLRFYVALARRPEEAMATPANVQEYYDEGTEAEPIIREMFQEKYDFDVVGDQREVNLDLGVIAGNHVIVRGHIDGIYQDNHDQGLFEAKKMRDGGAWEKFLRSGIECNINYPWQLSVYMHALELDECQFVGGRATFDDWGNMTIEEIKAKEVFNPPFSLIAIRRRIAEIEKLIVAGFDAGEVECNRSMYPCPFFKLHDEPEDAEEFAWPNDPGIAAMLNRLSTASKNKAFCKKSLEAAEAEYDKLVAELREKIKAEGPAAEAAKRLKGHGFTVNHVKGEVAEQIRKGYKLDYFKITPEKPEKGK